MRLYYMTAHEIATEHILREQRMKLSLFHELNDPFELQPHSLNDKDMRRISRALQSHITKSKGLICFSDNWRSPVMWAHYANKHSGVCLGFDIPDNGPDPLAGPVVYNPQRLQFVLDQRKNLFGIDEEFLRALLYTKSQEWAYEREWRSMADLKAKDPTTGFYYVEFGPQLQLREVILGARNEMPVGQMAKLVRNSRCPVQVLKARPAFQEFAMVRNKAVKAINVPSRNSR
jgi:hypothetical protein